LTFLKYEPILLIDNFFEKIEMVRQKTC
jgi:hypothetical protein